MRAIQQREFGGPEVLELVDLPIPEPSEAGDQVLIEVARAGINFADTHQREDGYVRKQHLPLIPGGEVAGVRTDTGERVVALTGHGGYAEYALAPEDRVFPIPDGLDDGAALALLIQGLTAWHLYRTCARVEGGESVLVVSGAGGVGSLAVQLGKAMGAGRVIATASSAEKRELCIELGADAAIDGDASDADALRDRILGANHGREVDVVLEMAGGPLFDVALRATADMGRMVVYGISSREQNEVRTGRLLKRSQSVIGFWLFHYLEQRRHLEQPLAELFALAARGDVTAVVGDTYALSDARRAQEDLVSRRTRGKLLLDPSR